MNVQPIGGYQALIDTALQTASPEARQILEPGYAPLTFRHREDDFFLRAIPILGFVFLILRRSKPDKIFLSIFLSVCFFAFWLDPLGYQSIPLPFYAVLAGAFLTGLFAKTQDINPNPKSTALIAHHSADDGRA